MQAYAPMHGLPSNLHASGQQNSDCVALPWQYTIRDNQLNIF